MVEAPFGVAYSRSDYGFFLLNAIRPRQLLCSKENKINSILFFQFKLYYLPVSGVPQTNKCILFAWLFFEISFPGLIHSDERNAITQLRSSTDSA